MYYIYIIKSGSKDDEIYVGRTTNPIKRLKEHNDGKSPSARRYKPWRMVYLEGYAGSEDAQHREDTLKQYGKSTANSNGEYGGVYPEKVWG